MTIGRNKEGRLEEERWKTGKNGMQMQETESVQVWLRNYKLAVLVQTVYIKPSFSLK